jgi:hypothetical protein
MSYIIRFVYEATCYLVGDSKLVLNWLQRNFYRGKRQIKIPRLVREQEKISKGSTACIAFI